MDVKVALTKTAYSVASLYGCSLEHAWCNWDFSSESIWFYRSEVFDKGELEFIIFEMAVFKNKSDRSTEELISKVSADLKELFPKAEIFGTVRDLCAQEVIYNDKLLTDGI